MCCSSSAVVFAVAVFLCVFWICYLFVFWLCVYLSVVPHVVFVCCMCVCYGWLLICVFWCIKMAFVPLCGGNCGLVGSRWGSWLKLSAG